LYGKQKTRTSRVFCLGSAPVTPTAKQEYPAGIKETSKDAYGKISYEVRRNPTLTFLGK
jgi:hypothetical protein